MSGWNGTGTFTQSAGNQTITGNLNLGRGPKTQVTAPS